MDWWWCLEHKQVERGPGCPNMARLGPYATEQEAAAAPERVRARTEAEDERDKADDEWGDPEWHRDSWGGKGSSDKPE